MIPKIVAVVGPTASGKTALGIALAKKFDGEIVSADSRQIYCGMDIGTGKPTTAEMDGIPHHLINIKNPNEEYTVADYKSDATAVINDTLSRGKLPILVGGTGLYLRSVVENLDVPKVKADPALRATLESEIARDGIATVFKKLLTLDPDAEGVVDPQNPRRVIRALEVAMTTGEPFTAQRKKQPPLFDTLTLGIDLSPELLRTRIDARIDRMMHDGLVEEVVSLIKKYGVDAPALNAIGYREIINHLDGKLSLNDAIAAIKMNTWHYAKRQITWFKKDKAIQWIDKPEDALLACKIFLE